MKVKIELELEKPRYDYFEKMAKALGMGGTEELLSKELIDLIDNVSLWIDREHITSLFSQPPTS